MLLSGTRLLISKTLNFSDLICYELELKGLINNALESNTNNALIFKELNASELRKLASKEIDLNQSYIDAFAQNSNNTVRCHGVVCSSTGALLSYAFTSDGPTIIDNGWIFNPGKNTIYLYKCFTHPTIRGKGLSQQVIKTALCAWPGASVAVAFVESNNHNSIKLFTKAGFTAKGRTIRIGPLKSALTHQLYHSSDNHHFNRITP